MKRWSKKLVRYIIEAGVASEELAEIYQYGFQMGLEMLVCFSVCFILALCLHMIPQFIVVSIIFILLRSYAGGIHLSSFGACFVCSVFVQTAILIVNDFYVSSLKISWFVIGISTILIWLATPIGNINREMSNAEKGHCKKVIQKSLIGIIVVSAILTILNMKKAISLVAITVLVVLISQYIGLIVYQVEKEKSERE